jgi:hypothetical protein
VNRATTVSSSIASADSSVNVEYKKSFPVPASELFLNHYGVDESDWDD